MFGIYLCCHDHDAVLVPQLSSTSSCIGTRVNGSDRFYMQWFSKSSATISYGTNLIIVAGFMFLVIKFQTTQIQLTWQVSLTDIRGDEGSFTIPIQFKVNDGVSS